MHQPNPDRINFILNGSVFNVTVDLLEELLTNAGHTLRSAVPLEVIDKVGYLKTGDDAKEIVADLLSQYMQNVIADADAGKCATADWPFKTSATDVQGTLDLDAELDAILDIDVGDIDLGTVYCNSDITGPLPAWRPIAGLNRGLIPFGNYVRYSEACEIEEDTSVYSACMNADRE
jgi:hypothetical protein